MDCHRPWPTVATYPFPSYGDSAKFGTAPEDAPTGGIAGAPINTEGALYEALVPAVLDSVTKGGGCG